METPGSRLAGVLALLLAIGTGLYGTFFWLLRDRGPPASSFPIAAEHLRAKYQPRDLIILAPAYATRAREELGDLHPVAPRDPLAEDFDIHPRVWVFALFGAGDELQASLPKRGLSFVERATPAPGITVDLYTNPNAVEVGFDFVKELSKARVHHEKGNDRVPCKDWQKVESVEPGLGKWACPYDKDWFYVGAEWHRMDGDMRWCLWAHPPTEGRLVITFPNVPLTGRLAGHAGHTENGSLYARAPIALEVTAGEALPQRFELALKDTWRPIGLVTAVGTGTVSFAISTPDAGTNHFCFALDTRGAGKP